MNVQLYVTSHETVASQTNGAQAENDSGKKQTTSINYVAKGEGLNDENGFGNGERQWLLGETTPETTKHVADLRNEKMKVEKVIREAVETVGKYQRVLVAACGPQSLMDAVRDSADRYRKDAGYMMDVHCESFGG